MEDSVFQHSSKDFAESILDAVDIITDQKLKEAKFDRTIQATVLSCTSNTKGEYRCKYQDSKFLAYTSNPDITYSENALVYILIPGNDWDATKTILGTVDKLGVDYIANISNKEYFDPIGENVVDNQHFALHLQSWYGTRSFTVYDKEQDINLIDLNTEKISDYFTQKEAEYFYVQMKVWSNIDKTQSYGRYGIKITTKNASKGFEHTYVYNSDSMEGEPRNFIVPSVQNNVKNPFQIDTTLEKNTAINDFGEISKIELFVESFREEEDHDYDIIISEIQLTALHQLTEMDMTDGYLSIITPKGSVFYNDNNNIIPSFLQLIGQVRLNGIIAEDTDIKFYWFRQDARVYGGSSFEYLYCPIAGTNNNGWACLNNSRLDNGIRIWDSGLSELDLKPEDIPTKKMLYKCVAIYDDIVMEREITILNKAAQYDISISSSEGYSFTQSQGETILTCNIEPEPSQEYQHYWASIGSEGIFSTYGWDKNSDTIEAKSIIDYTRYICTIYALNQFLGSAMVTLVNSDQVAAGTYHLSIANGSQLFKYDTEGQSPASDIHTYPQVIPKLEVDFSDLQGNQLSREEVLRSTNIKWYFPKDNTMLIPPEIEGYEPYEYTDESGKTYLVYENFYDIGYTIEDDYDWTKLDNQIKLSVSFNGVNYSSITNLLFTKEGSLGTNGTKYTCKIAPNSTTTFNDTRVFITELSTGNYSFNFAYPNGEFPFKVKVWKGSELIYSSWDHQVQNGIDINITWDICDGNTESFYEVNAPNFTYKGFPQTIPSNFNNLLRATINISGTDDAKIIYDFLPIGVVKILNPALDTYNIGLYKQDNIYSGFTTVVYNTDGENPLYDEKKDNPFRPVVINYNGEDVTDNYNILQTFVGTDLVHEDEDDPTSRIVPVEFYTGLQVCNAVVYRVSSNFIIYAPVAFLYNRYGLSALNAWDGTHINIDENSGYIYAPQMGAGQKESDNSFTGVLLGKVDIPNSTDKVGFMAYGHGTRTVFIDAETGKAEFGSGGGKIVIDPSSSTGDDACIYGGGYELDNETGMVINLTTPYIKWGNGNFEVDADGLIKAINVTLKNSNNSTYFSINQHGLLIDVGSTGTYDNPNPPSSGHRKLVLYNSNVNPTASAIAIYPTNSVAEFGDDGIILQSLHKGSYFYMKDANDPSSKGANTSLSSANSLYLSSGMVDFAGDPDPDIPEEETDDENNTTNASVTVKGAYNCNVWAGHGLSLKVTGPHEKDGGAHSNYPDPHFNDTYGYMKLETQYGWIYLSSKAGGRKNTPGIGINAYTWKYREENRGESEEDPYTRYPNRDYKVYINGNEVLDVGNAAEATGGDLGGAVYVSEFGNLRPYLDKLVSLGSYYEEGDGIAAWRHVVTYDTIQVSDKREKEDIEDLDSRYVDFIMNLKPKRYHYKKTGEKEYRTGFIAQDVEMNLDDVGLKNEEFGGLKKKPIIMYGDTVDYGYGLNYDDFVSALVLTVQDLQKQINELKKEIKKDGT